MGEESKSSTGRKGISSIAVLAGAYLLLHTLNMLPNGLDVLPHGTLRSADLELTIGNRLAQITGVPVIAMCPANIPLRGGEITDCTAVDGTTSRIVRVTQDDSKGHYHWQLTNQEPGTS
jgi:hypothetical protein